MPQQPQDDPVGVSILTGIAEAGTEAATEQLRSAVAGVVAQFGRELGASPDSDPMRAALADWSKRLLDHVQELEYIVKGRTPTAAGVRQDEVTATATQSEAAEADEELDMNAGAEAEDEAELACDLADNLEEVRNLRLQLECHRTGRDAEEVASAWCDPEETAREVAELRRVRRQIRYLFGGMLSSLPDSTSLHVDDLLSDNEEAEVSRAAFGARPSYDVPQVDRAAAAESLQPAVLEVKAPPRAQELRTDVPETQKAAPAGRRPRSGGTELSSVGNSSALSWSSQATRGEEDARRRERKERKQRRQRRLEESEEDALALREQKREDGAPPKQWNWAEEVVKASLDPQNQWEFPGPGSNSARGAAAHIRQLPPPVWEQPRQAGVAGGLGNHARGSEIASRARERAEEVQRLEREQHREHHRLFGTPDRGGARPFL